MTEIDEYARIIVYRNQNELAMPASYSRIPEHIEAIKQIVEANLQKLDQDSVVDKQSVAEEIFSNLIDGGVFDFKDNKFAGSYFKYLPDKYHDVRRTVLSNSDIHEEASTIGKRFFPDVFAGYVGDNLGDSGVTYSVEVPASDRVVTLSHNQAADLEDSSTALIDAVDSANGIDGDPELRQQILGQLRAGRELIRSHTLRAYLLYQSVVTILGGLIERYKGHAIGQTAQKLLDLLIEHIFKS